MARLYDRGYGEKHDFWHVWKIGNRYKVVYVNRGGGGQFGASDKAAPSAPDDGRFSQSISRAKRRIFELAACNEFTHFCTFTQSAELRDRFDLPAFREDFAQFVRNLNRGRAEGAKIRYLLIPEQHKDGAWHMHGLLMGLKSEDLEKNENGFLDWVKYRRKFGFFSVSRIKSHEKCSAYMTKYITKSLAKTSIQGGGHLFFASQGLKGAECVAHGITDHCPVEKWDFENEWVKVKWVSDLSDIEF